MPRSAPRPFLLAVLVLSLGGACRREPAGAPPERYLSPRVEFAVVVPELSRAARELSALRQTATAIPGLEERLAAIRPALVGQLGLDPLDPESLAGAGLDPARGAALGFEPSGEGRPGTPVLALPVGDAGRLLALVTRMARERLGATERSTLSLGGVRVVTFRVAGRGEPALSLAFLDGARVAALAPGPGGAKAAGAALSRRPADSLSEEPAWRGLRATMATRYAIVAGAVPPSSVLPGPASSGLAVGVSAAPGALRIGVATRLPPSNGARGPGSRGEADAAIRALSPRSALVVAWNADPSALGARVVSGLAAHDREWLAAHGFDLERDVFDVLAPGAAASLSLSPRLDLAGFSPEAVRADPLRAIRFELVSPVRDEATAARTLARLPALVAALAGADPPAPPHVDPSGRTGRIALPSGEIAWRLEGRRLSMAGGEPGMLAALSEPSRSTGYAAPTPAAAAALKAPLGGAVLDPRALAESVRALPEDAFGAGPSGFLIRSIVERLLEPAERVSAVSLRAEPAERATFSELLLEVSQTGASEAGR
ncbi:MAG TPA: hypothetical protein VFG59_08280 [Anaeromyxobacter sp.]|nr:hypothetical protein [Anaeromyxobacter sp.]